MLQLIRPVDFRGFWPGVDQASFRHSHSGITVCRNICIFRRAKLAKVGKSQIGPPSCSGAARLLLCGEMCIFRLSQLPATYFPLFQITEI